MRQLLWSWINVACGTGIRQTMCHIFSLHCGVFLRGYVACGNGLRSQICSTDSSVQLQMACDAWFVSNLHGVCGTGFHNTIWWTVSALELQKTYLRSKPLQNIACHCIGGQGIALRRLCMYGFWEAMWRVALASAINLLNSSLSFRGPVMLCWFRIYMVCGTGLHNVMNSFFLELQKTCDDPLEVALSS